MIRLIRNLLFLLLVQLQLYAPLVHAHVEGHADNRGLHIPGLEIHAALSHELTLVASHYEFSSNNLIVSIDNGFKDKRATLVLDNDDPAYIDQPGFVVRASIAATDRNFSPHQQTIAQSVLISPFAPRAPPAI